MAQTLTRRVGLNRSLAYAATGICAAPLLVIAGMALTHALTRSAGSDQAIAQGYTTILGGIACAIVGGAALWFLARNLVPERHLGALLVVDAVILVIGIIIAQRTFAITPQLEVAEEFGATVRQGTPLLQVEARVPQELLAGDQLDAVVAIDFAGGEDASVPHPELARIEGNATILPWETTPIRVDAWRVRVIVRSAELMFELPLAKIPVPSLEWSDWLAPGRGSTGNAPGVTLRYRYQVTAREK